MVFCPKGVLANGPEKGQLAPKPLPLQPAPAARRTFKVISRDRSISCGGKSWNALKSVRKPFQLLVRKTRARA